ncbi:hypothetical protein WJU23_07590 [Prosthecobacter sp. SYSU 5D2]|uniref:hypothetical protein n=1 Tax=Prosthecobacter sp. SYSU 5D2 TaxID=3134134 RepID=UPI0031FEC16D
MTDTEDPPLERDLGTQPLDSIMTGAGLDNHDLVSASTEPMTHKAVQRARKGRRLTVHMQRRMVAALNKALALKETPPEREWRMKDLFTY